MMIADIREASACCLQRLTYLLNKQLFDTCFIRPIDETPGLRIGLQGTIDLSRRAPPRPFVGMISSQHRRPTDSSQFVSKAL